MKNQYFGDENDYKKYGLLRALTGRGELSTAVCWMLTPDDRGSDGRFTEYLSQPAQWRHYDAELYDRLREAVVNQKRRDVQYAAEEGLLPGARLYDPLLPDDAADRAEYFQSLWAATQDCSLVFFDPDNGLEVNSKPYGHKGSSKYLYWHELTQTLSQGHSALVYQHFPRVERDGFIVQKTQEMRERTRASVIYSFRTNRVVFFLLPLEHHIPSFESRLAQLERAWTGQIEMRKHACA